MDAPLPPAAALSSSSPRLLALDIGNRRIGVAMTDPRGCTAQPLLTLYRKTPRADLKSIGRLLRRFAIAEIVVGHPLHMSGEVSPQANKAQRFAEDLRAAFPQPVHLIDERLTTAEAHGYLDRLGRPREGRDAIIDQIAAVIILESFLSHRDHLAAIAAARSAP